MHRIDEAELPAQTGPWLLPGATPDVVNQVPWLQPDFADDGILRLAGHSFALEVNGLRVLVDTGIGNGKTRANPAWHNLDTPYLQRLTDAGFRLESRPRDSERLPAGLHVRRLSLAAGARGIRFDEVDGVRSVIMDWSPDEDLTALAAKLPELRRLVLRHAPPGTTIPPLPGIRVSLCPSYRPTR